MQSQLGGGEGGGEEGGRRQEARRDDHGRHPAEARKVESRLKELDAEKGAAIAREVKAAAKARKERGRSRLKLMQQLRRWPAATPPTAPTTRTEGGGGEDAPREPPRADRGSGERGGDGTGGSATRGDGEDRVETARVCRDDTVVHYRTRPTHTAVKRTSDAVELVGALPPL